MPYGKIKLKKLPITVKLK